MSFVERVSLFQSIQYQRFHLIYLLCIYVRTYCLYVLAKLLNENSVPAKFDFTRVEGKGVNWRLQMNW